MPSLLGEAVFGCVFGVLPALRDAEMRCCSAGGIHSPCSWWSLNGRLEEPRISRWLLGNGRWRNLAICLRRGSLASRASPDPYQLLADGRRGSCPLAFPVLPRRRRASCGQHRTPKGDMQPACRGRTFRRTSHACCFVPTHYGLRSRRNRRARPAWQTPSSSLADGRVPTASYPVSHRSTGTPILDATQPGPLFFMHWSLDAPI